MLCFILFKVDKKRHQSNINGHACDVLIINLKHKEQLLLLEYWAFIVTWLQVFVFWVIATS